MVRRERWIELIGAAWARRSVVWLAGVRRVGKTFLCRDLAGVEYFDCELPRTRRLMDDPEGFLAELRGRRVVLDEVHRLGNPSELLKIAADHFPETRVLATGSSTLGSTKKFRDTLAGRKETVWLTPMLLSEVEGFSRVIPGASPGRGMDLSHRLLRGGLPPFFLAAQPPDREYQEWLDAYWAKDLQELFRVERRWSFQRFAELLFTRSGGIFEATRFAVPCEVSRQTIMNYLDVLDATFVVHIVRPYSGRRSTEIVAAPKVYGFDTGFVCHHRGWESLRQEDLGHLWEHVVLNEIQGRLQRRNLNYWRNKRGAEVDFVLPRRGRGGPIAIECKWTAAAFEESALRSFRHIHPAGENFVVSRDVEQPFKRTFGDMAVEFLPLEQLIQRLSAEPLAGE